MPTLSAIQFDRFLESKTTSSKDTQNIPDASHFSRRNTTSLKYDDLKTPSKNKDIPPPYPHLRRRNSTSSPAGAAAGQMLPALYATPESTPLPDSPTSSFPPSSPFLINHKRRGPRLLKSLSHQNMAAAAEVAGGAGGAHGRSLSEERLPIESQEEVVDENSEVTGSNSGVSEIVVEGGESNRNANGNGIGDGSMKENVESEDFFDPQESMSFSGTADSDDFGERSAKGLTPMGEFFDAWEELSSDSGMQTQQRSLNDVETELREMRLSLLMEIEKRKQAEETLQVMQQQWQMLREKLDAVGLVLPADLTNLTEDSQSDAGPVEEICRQIQLTRFVSECIGRGIAKAEAEAEMEAQLEVKNFEIARLSDRLHYYETMNQEMSQRNQEAIEIARQERQKRRRRQKWIWGTLGTTAITLGTVLAWSYLPGGKGSSTSEVSRRDLK